MISLITGKGQKLRIIILEGLVAILSFRRAGVVKYDGNKKIGFCWSGVETCEPASGNTARSHQQKPSPCRKFADLFNLLSGQLRRH